MRRRVSCTFRDIFRLVVFSKIYKQVNITRITLTHKIQMYRFFSGTYDLVIRKEWGEMGKPKFKTPLNHEPQQMGQSLSPHRTYTIGLLWGQNQEGQNVHHPELLGRDVWQAGALSLPTAAYSGTAAHSKKAQYHLPLLFILRATSNGSLKKWHKNILNK